MKDNRFLVQFSKDLYFVLLISLFTTYLISLYVISKELVKSCYTQVLLISNTSTWEILQTKGFYLYLLAFLIVSLLLAKVFKAFIKTIISTIYTIHIQEQLGSIATREFFVFKSSIPKAFTLGFLKPKIYISSSLLKQVSSEELELILLHEKQHCNSYDPLRKLVSNLVKNSLPFFPFKNLMFENYTRLSEILADHALTRVSDNMMNNLLKKISTTKISFEIINNGFVEINRLKKDKLLTKTILSLLVLGLIQYGILFSVTSIKAEKIFNPCVNDNTCTSSTSKNNISYINSLYCEQLNLSRSSAPLTRY